MNSIENFLTKCLNEILFNKLNLSISEERMNSISAKFLLYMAELKKWNKTYNLTSIEDERDIIIKHFADSLLYLCFIPEGKLSIADIGSGAGFPGIPIAILREDLYVTLVEPSWKKVAFLKNIKKKLELSNIDILQARVEDVDRKFDIVLTRALWSMGDFLKKCKGLIKEGGYFLIGKAAKLNQELIDLPDNIRIDILEFSLPKTELSSKEIKRAIIKLCVC